VDRNGAPIGAVSLAASLSEWTRDKFARRFGPMVVAAAQAISGSGDSKGAFAHRANAGICCVRHKEPLTA
jgi:hypothetical protein